MARYARPPKNADTFDALKGKILWATTGIGNFILSKIRIEKKDGLDDVYDSDQEAGEDVIIYLPYYLERGQFSRSYQFSITDLTEDEFILFRKIIATALKQAEPIIKVRDADAKSKLDSGGIAPSRAYRAIPRLFTPNGEVK